MKWNNSREEILATPHPTKQGRYCPIPHSVFLEEIQEELDKKNYKITREKYLTASNNQIITGNFVIGGANDMEINPSIYFTNSYNKMKKASIRGGATVLVCTNGMVGTIADSAYSRKHLGDNALTDFRINMKKAVDGLEREFERLIINKEEMKNIHIPSHTRNALIGEMYIEHALLNPTQLSVLNTEIKTSKNFKDDTVWSLYNNTTEALKDNHPLKYEKDLIKLHTFISDQFDLTGATHLYKRVI